MKIDRLSVDEALEGVGSCSQGLSSVEALYRLRTFGPNRIETVARRHPALRLLAEFAQFFSLILWVAAALAFTADWYVPGQGMAQVGYAVVAVIVVSGLFSFWQEHRIEQTLAALQKLLPQNARAMRDGSVVELPVEQLVTGDVILLQEGDNVPADCRVLEFCQGASQHRNSHGRIGLQSAECEGRGGRRPHPQQEHPLGRHLVGVGSMPGARVRHGRAHPIRHDCPAGASGKLCAFSVAQAARPTQPTDRHSGSGDRDGLLCDRCGDRCADLRRILSFPSASSSPWCRRGCCRR